MFGLDTSLVKKDDGGVSFEDFVRVKYLMIIYLSQTCCFFLYSLEF